MTALPTVDLTVYPFECDAFGHLNEASFLALFERARWDALAKGPGMDLFKRNHVWPAVRKATVEYRAGAFPGDVLSIETVLTDRGTTSFTMQHVAKRLSDSALIAEATLVFVCIDRAGRPTPIPDEVARALGGPRGTARDPLRVAAGGADLAVEVRGEGVPILFIHGFPFDRTMWRHQLAGLSRWKRIAPDLRGAGASSAPADGYSVARYADDVVQVLDTLELERTVMCGLSLGGYVLFELLRRHPGRVRAAVFCNTKAVADSSEARRGRDEMASGRRATTAAGARAGDIRGPTRRGGARARDDHPDAGPRTRRGAARAARPAGLNSDAWLDRRARTRDRGRGR